MANSLHGKGEINIGQIHGVPLLYMLIEELAKSSDFRYHNGLETSDAFPTEKRVQSLASLAVKIMGPSPSYRQGHR